MSEIAEFYRDKSILLTGSTGFLGQLILEKLLRCCNVKEVYILIRGKKGKSWQTRVQEMLADPVFERLNSESPLAAEKIKGVVGDCCLPKLGINDFDRELLINNVQIVIHSAATIKFDESLSDALQINALGTKFLLDLSKEMKNLMAFLYVSTAFSNCNRQEINEKLCAPPITVEQIQQTLHRIHDKSGVVEKQLMCGFPNTYILAKCLAESVVAEASKELPVIVFRPAIVMPTASEPVIGWTNSFNGAMGIVYGVTMGIIHTFHMDVNTKAQLVPADYCVNAILAAIWDQCTTKRNVVPIYNFVTHNKRPIAWGKFCHVLEAEMIKYPSMGTFGPISFNPVSNFYHYKFLKFFYHTLPAMLFDAILSYKGHKLRLSKIYEKFEKLHDLLAFFTCSPFVFEHKQMERLWQKMTIYDKKIFKFNMSEIDWESYLKNTYHGMRKFKLKEDKSNVSVSKKRQDNIQTMFKCFIWFTRCLGFVFVYMIAKKLFS